MKKFFVYMRCMNGRSIACELRVLYPSVRKIFKALENMEDIARDIHLESI